MKIIVRLLIMTCAIVAVLICYKHCGADATSPALTPMSTITYEKILVNQSTAWIKHAFYPTEESVRNMRYIGDVDTETAELCEILQERLKQEFCPSTDDLSTKIVPLTKLWDDSDYLLLQYTTKSGYNVRLQDGRDLYLFVSVPDSTSETNIEDLVKETAKSVLNTSEASLENQSKPGIWTWSIDIGESKSGQLRYGFSPSTNYPDWYTSIPWWSDGRNVMFMISKFDFSKLATTSNKPAPKPRVFKTRIGS